MGSKEGVHMAAFISRRSNSSLWTCISSAAHVLRKVERALRISVNPISILLHFCSRSSAELCTTYSGLISSAEKDILYLNLVVSDVQGQISPSSSGGESENGDA